MTPIKLVGSVHFILAAAVATLLWILPTRPQVQDARPTPTVCYHHTGPSSFAASCATNL